MNVWTMRIVALLALTLTTVLHQTARADDEPKVLDLVATVLEAFEYPATDNHNPLTHSHKGFDTWPTKPGSKFEVNRRWAIDRPHFFDVPWSITSEMQDPDLHVINPRENPISKDHFGGNASFEAAKKMIVDTKSAMPVAGPHQIKIKDFIFLFDIHNLENSDGSTTPHAVIYIPYRKDDQLNPELADFYRLYIVHIPQEECACTEIQWSVGRRFCEAMRRLASKWSSGYYTEKGLTEEARRESRELLDHLFDEPPPPDDGSGHDDPVSEFIRILFGQKLHNGIIHGTLGGG